MLSSVCAAKHPSRILDPVTKPHSASTGTLFQQMTQESNFCLSSDASYRSQNATTQTAYFLDLQYHITTPSQKVLECFKAPQKVSSAL